MGFRLRHRNIPSDFQKCPEYVSNFPEFSLSFPELKKSLSFQSCKHPAELTLLTVLSVVLLLQSRIHLAMTFSLALHLLYLSLPLRHSYSVRHLGLVGSHDRNLSVSAFGVFDILALHKLDYYYYFLIIIITIII